MSDVCKEELKQELLESFSMYADSEYNEDLLPVSRIIFSAQGEVTSPPDLEFMGYGVGPEGEAFEACGGLDLSEFFPLEDDGESYRDDVEECFSAASSAVLSALQVVAASDNFQAIPKRGPVVFALDLEDQVTKVLCRIHPDGTLELPPAK